MEDAVFKSLSDSMREVMDLLVNESRAELERQGHVLTGALRDSITYEIEATDTAVTGFLIGADYGVVVEFGVAAERIPFGGGGGGGKSKYIEGLVRFFQLRGLEPREALRAAFATATVHKREGMPSKGSFRFSQNGRRTGFVASSAELLFERFAEILENKTNLQLELLIAPEFNFEPIKVF